MKRQIDKEVGKVCVDWGGKGRFKGLLIAREYLEGEVQIARKGMGEEPFFIFTTVNTLNVKHPLFEL